MALELEPLCSQRKRGFVAGIRRRNVFCWLVRVLHGVKICTFGPEGPGAPVLAVLGALLRPRLKVLLRFLPVEDIGLVRVETFFPPVNNPLGHDPIGEPVG